jgi:metal-responsive CopG/Arc/MetJ family transcriptional regulator
MEFKKITITLPETLIKKYRQYCDDNGMNFSKRISILLRDDLKNNLNNKGKTNNEDTINKKRSL